MLDVERRKQARLRSRSGAKYRRGIVALGLAALLLLIVPGGISFATPSPPYVLVNESTRQCYVTIMNDECVWCDPPQGWKALGVGTAGYGTMDCPAGFQKIDHLELNCRRYQIPFCCGGFSSYGDCEDMVINATQQVCAFVDDVNACVLPKGWSKRPADVRQGGWSCNFTTYKWVDDVTCLTSTETPEALSVQNVVAQHPQALPLTGIGLIALGVAVLAWLARRR